MAVHRLLVAAALSAVAAAQAAWMPPMATATTATTARTAAVVNVRVGSFNLFGVNSDKTAGGEQRKWRARRPVVVQQILSRRLDVVGLQEANPSRIYRKNLDFGSTQFADLVGALARRGAHYRVTNGYSFNCVNPRSTYKCVYRDRKAAGDDRIIYNRARLALVRRGAHRYVAQTSGKVARYLEWAVFAVRGTGKRFLFTNTHLDPYGATTRTAQWDEAIAMTNQLKGDLPLIAVGDYNTSKFDEAAATFLPRMRANGYGDVLNQRYRTPYAHPRARIVRRGWVNSYNRFRRDVRSYAYEDARHKIGNGIDWIFASNDLRVRGYETVLNLNARRLRLRGVIPSDHALVRATVILP